MRALPVTRIGWTGFVEVVGTGGAPLLVQLADRVLDVTKRPKRYSMEG